DAAAISAVGYPECRSAFARALRTGSVDRAQHQTIRRRFELDWGQLVVIPADESTLHLAGDLVDQYTLRGFDAVHLASAAALRTAQSDLPITFIAWDQRLLQAARGEDFAVAGG
ncbi:MAG TPA: type II toxin-antitoxin system VapC family toxin, partial [Chloroflexota bacterium]